MKRQKNLVQSKIVQTTPERGPAEIDLTSLPEKEFKIKIINMLTELQRNMQELRDEVRREITDVRREITDVQREITEKKQTLEEFINRMDEMQEAINVIETREQECIEADAERDKRISRNETKLRER